MNFRDDPYAQSDQKDHAIPLNKHRERPHSSKTRSAYKRMWLFEKDNFTVTTTYVVSEIIDMRLYRSLVIHLINKDKTNDLLYKVDVCLSPDAKWRNRVAETTITHNAAGDADAAETLSDDWAFVRVQCKSSAATIQIKVIAGLKT